MIKTKKQTVIDLVKEDKIKEALRIAKGFLIEFNKEEREILSIAYECLAGKQNFYSQLGKDCEAIKQQATELIKKYPNHR